MASSQPMKKNTATTVVFPILDADGDLVTGATALDSEYSLDGAGFLDCASEAAEIGTTGIYSLALAAGETNGDVVCIQVKTTTVGAKTTPLVFYTAAQTLDDIEALVDDIGVAGAGLTAVPWNAAWDAEVESEATDALNAYDPPTNAEMVARTLAAASYALEATLTTITGLVDDLEGRLTAARAGYLDELAAANIPADVDTLLARLTALRAGYLDNLSAGAAALEATVAALNNLSAAAVNAEVVDALATDTYAEPTGVPAATDDLATKLGYLYMMARNRIDVTASKKTVYGDDDAAEFEKDLTDDGTTYSESEANAI